MQENKKRELLESELREELNWYTLYATDEEYDQKAVDSIMYLLDRWEPLEEGTVPPVEESWKRFLKVAGRKELLPLEDAAETRKPVSGESVAGVRKSVPGESVAEVRKPVPGERIAETRKPVSGRSETGFSIMQARKAGEELPSEDEMGEGLWSMQKADFEDELFLRERAEGDKPESMEEDMADNIVHMSPEEDENSGVVGGTGKQDGHKKTGKLAKFASRHKIIAAAALVLMVLMVGNTIHAVANPETGFFFWLNRDDSGVKMMTSPEGLDSETKDHISTYYNEEDVPEWAKKWVQIETGIEFETKDIYEFQHIEISESDNRQHVTSYFVCENLNKDIYVGVWVYWDKVSYFKEEFVGYDHVQSYEFAQKEIDIYKKTEDTGQTYYIVCFYEGNCKYYVKGQEKLDELKRIIEECWEYVQKNF